MTDDIGRKDTDDLKEELMSASDLDAFLTENASELNDKELKDILNVLFLRTEYTKAELARRSGISTVYLHQLFSGKRTPSRDKLICLGFGLGVSFEDMQKLLRTSGFAELYPKDKRDTIIIYGISHGLSLQEVNDLLFDKDEEALL